MARCVILSAGRVEHPALLKAYLRPDDWFVAADGGLCLAERLGVTPSLLVADFDSGQAPSTEAYPDLEIRQFPPEKDWTDTLAAAITALERGARDFLLLGATGGRLDHTLANLAVLLYLRKHGAQAMAVDEWDQIQMLLPGDYILPVQKGWRLSLLAYGGEVRGVTLQDVQYPLKDAVLTPDYPLGISNEFTDRPARISFREGILMQLITRDDPASAFLPRR